MLIYVSHPYGGLEENKEKVEGIVRSLAKRFPLETYVSPIHTFGFLYEDVSYKQGIKMCLNLLDACDYVIVFGEYKKSKGCRIEIMHARKHDIPTYYSKDYTVLTDIGGNYGKTD
jgi:hypothetical protein